MSATRSFEIHAFGSRIRATADNTEAYSVLERYIFPSLPRFTPAAEEPDLSLRMDRSAKQFHLVAGGLPVTASSSAESLVVDLIRILDEFILQRLRTLRAIHAGAVLWQGRVLLFPGSTHAGKSSLVAELLRRGATYFSDEYALIDAEGRVHPYPRPLLVRNGSPQQQPLLAADCKAAVADTPAPIGWILALHYTPGGAWSIAPISKSEALLMLLRNTPHVLAESPDLLPVFHRAVADAACYVGLRAEAAQAGDEILRLISAN